MLREIGEAGEDTARSLAPEQSGHFAETISHEVGPDWVEIGSTSRRAHLVESGRTAGKMPPPTLLADVLGVPVGEAFLIARRIGRSGTDGSRVFEFTERMIDLEVNDAAEKLAEQIGALRT